MYQDQYDFSLTNIPYGNHHLIVNTSCVVLILDQWQPMSSHPFFDGTEKWLNFTVASNSPQTPSPFPTPKPTQTPQLSVEPLWVAVPIIIVAAAVALTYLRRRKQSKVNVAVSWETQVFG
jgi:hypothetical protein